MPPPEQIEQVFHETINLPEGVDRAEWLAKRCAGDEDLLREVSSLLEANARMAGWEANSEEPPGLPAGPFGVYRPIRLLGHGGMSTVYLAERADGQFEQTVALKVMAAYLSGPEFLRRFQSEGRMLASLHHPNITKLFDGGVSPAGEPFLILEYVDGESLDCYCDRRKLPIEARLRIFVQVCDAVDYAHRNLILHRDLKPGNILVTADGTPKLLDFGTASLMQADAIVTLTRARMLTPRYASPEQLRGATVGVTSDVFSLGVVLYELLTGAWPFGTSPSVVTDLRRAAGEAVGTQPGSAITKEAAALRSQPLRRLRTALSGDLSAIAMKSLENDAGRRYATVHDLAEDIERFLEGRPVRARPQTLAYRAGKFLRRRWLPVGATAVFVAGLGAATAIAIQQARSAHAEAVKSQQVNEFLTGILSSASQPRFDPQKYTVAQMLDAAEERLAKHSGQDPLIEALERMSLARSYMRMRLAGKAAAQLDRAIPKLEALGRNGDLADALETRAMVAGDQGRLEASVRNWERSLGLLQQMGRNAPSLLVFQAKYNLAHTLSFLMHTQVERARQLYLDAIAVARNDASIPRTQLADCLSDYASLLAAEGQGREAEALQLEALATGRKEDPGGLWESQPLYALAVLRGTQGDPAGAKAYAAQMVEVATRTVGPDSAEAAQAKIVWAIPAARTGELDKAAKAVEEAMPVIQKRFASPSLDLWLALRNASGVTRLAGRYAEAERYARESLQVAEDAHMGRDDPRLGNSWEWLGEALCKENKSAEGIAALQQAQTIYRNAGAPWATTSARVSVRIAEVRAKTPQ
jgi:serine/threonine protein kinase